MDEEREFNYTMMSYAEKSLMHNTHFYNLFAQDYNKVAKRITPVQALSNLSQIKDDIAKERDTIYDSILYIKEELDELLEKVDHNNQYLLYRKRAIEESISSIMRGGYKIYDYNKFIVDKEVFKEAVNYLKSDTKFDGIKNLDQLTEKLYNRKDEIIYVNSQYVGLTDVITDIIKEGYPPKIDELSEQEVKDKQDKKKQGRPPIIPKELIQDRVLELIEKGRKEKPGYKKYWHHNGQYKNSPNISQLANRLYEDGNVDGDIELKTLKRKIKSIYYSEHGQK